jgi:hypothetical protein
MTFRVHWYTTGDGLTLARGIAAALATTISAQRSAPESE